MDKYIRDNKITATLIVSILLMGIFAFRKISDIRNPDNNISVSYETNQKCSKDSDVYFKLNNFDPDNTAYENHYNARLGKCFISIESVKIVKDGIERYKNLIDVLEKKEYGYYLYTGKGTMEFKPSWCFLRPTGNKADEIACNNLGEYDTFTRKYMED